MIVHIRAAALAAAVLFAGGAAFAQPSAGLPSLETTADVLFWEQDEREAGFRAMDRITPHRTVAAGNWTRGLPAGEPLDVDMGAFMDAHGTAGLLVLQDGRIRLERYGLGFGPEGRWTSFSVAKSVTSTLVGAAIRDGHIDSLETPILTYLPELAGSAYDGVTVRQLLTMTSGADWNEDYTDPEADVSRFFRPRQLAEGEDATLAYMRTLRRGAAPGQRWLYSTGETNLVGVLVTRATGQTLAEYLSEKIWRPYGMERDAAWMIDEGGQEASGCCLMASLRDWGRFGQFILDGGDVDGTPIAPNRWFDQATTRQADIGVPGRGYGFQWWTRDDGSFDARGIFGQMIHIDPERRLVIVMLSAWPVATGEAQSQAREELIARVVEAAER